MLDEELAKALQNLVFFQRRAYQKNPYSAKSKRRLVSGVKECRRACDSHRPPVYLVVSTDTPEPVLLSIEFKEMMRAAKTKDVKVIWSVILPSELGAVVAGGRAKTCCVAVLSLEGCREQFKEIEAEVDKRQCESAAKMKAEEMFEIAAKYGIESAFGDDGHTCKSIPDGIILTAVRYGHIELARKLLTRAHDLGVDILEEACKYGDHEMACCLIESGNIRITTDAIKWSLLSCNQKLIKTILELRGADALPLNDLLCIAAQCRNAVALEALLSVANADIIDCQPLYDLAIQAKSLECAKLLKRRTGIGK